MVSLNPLKWFKKSESIESIESIESYLVDDLNPEVYSGQSSFSPWENSIYDGDKFPGGFGPTQIQLTDYWTLRARSEQLYRENHYASGIINCIVTNQINKGLTPEACPDEGIIGVQEDSLNEWTEMVENRFSVWAKNPKLCDWKHSCAFGEIQRQARIESLISGDVLVVLRQSPRTKLPMVQLVSGNKVQTPLGGSGNLRKGHIIRHGVELDSVGRVAAHWVRQDDGSSKRLPAYGEKSGRKISWLVYGHDKRLDEVRGQPFLSIVLQSLKEVDRYRDSAQRKAVINSILALFIKKTQDKPSTLPMTGGAVRRDKVTTTDSDGGKRKFNTASQIPGLVLEELQVGEEPVLKGGEGTDVNFGVFEESIMQSVAWSLGIPPEIMRLTFSKNYSASAAAVNEFKIAIDMKWGSWGDNFCSPIYVEWLLSETLQQKIQAQSFLASWRNPDQYDIFGAWIAADWYGSIKPSTDMLKQVKASDLLVKTGLSTRAREARITTGTKFSKNIKRLKRENQQIVDAMRPLADFKNEFDGKLAPDVAKELDKNIKTQLHSLKGMGNG